MKTALLHWMVQRCIQNLPAVLESQITTNSKLHLQITKNAKQKADDLFSTTVANGVLV